jgi:hypothetical protein
MKYFKFVRENSGRWYIVLPEWEGDRADLEMVLGADTMLEIYAQGENKVELSISTEHFDGAHELQYIRPEGGGGWYNYKSDIQEFEVWLCFVTKFVFGYFPQRIYLR